MKTLIAVGLTTLLAAATEAGQTHIISTARCTLVDTRAVDGPFGGPRMQPGVTRSFPVPNGPCGVPAASRYVLTFTAIGADAPSVALRAWATGSPVPSTPTLTLKKGTGGDPNNTTSRSTTVDASPAGSINVQTDVGTHLLIELTAYYADGVVLNVSAGTGLTGGGTGNVILGIAAGGVGPTELSATGSAPGQALMSNGTSVSWQTPPQGTVTGVTAGPGLTGGGAGGSIGLSANFTPSGGSNGTATTIARGDHRHYVQTVVVSPQGSPGASGTALLNAIASITDASATKAYLVKIEPGIYDVGSTSLRMKQWVAIRGSGSSATTITGATNTLNYGTVHAASNSELSDATIESTNGGTYALALTIFGATNFSLDHVVVSTTGPANIYGVKVDAGGTATFQDTAIHAVATAGAAVGLFIVSPIASIELQRCAITVEASTAGTGVNTSGSLALDDSTVIASGNFVVAIQSSFGTPPTVVRHCRLQASANGSTSSGIESSAMLTLTDSEVTASTTTNSLALGVRCFGSATISNTLVRAQSTGGGSNTAAVTGDATSGSWVITVENSRLIAVGQTARGGAFTTMRIAASRLEGGFATGTCAGVWDENFVFYPSTCP